LTISATTPANQEPDGSVAGPRIVIVGFPSARILDVTGPLEVFSSASRFG
jgi:hypothetical protein